MIRLFCRCGYPLWLAARWTGDDIALVLFDGNEPPARRLEGLAHCPQCQEVLTAADFAEQALPPRFKSPDSNRTS